MSKKKINWKNEAAKAAEFASEVLSEGHREVIPWHKGTNTWLVFDTAAPDRHPEGYLEMLCENLEHASMEVRASAITKEKDTLGVLFTFNPRDARKYSFDEDSAREVAWGLWRDETDMIIDDMPEDEQEDARKSRELQEVIQRHKAAERVERYLMKRPSKWDSELEAAYKASR
jgi:hypothetical protein